MKRTVVFLAVFLVTVSALADDSRTERRKLIREFLDVINAKELTRDSIDAAFPWDDNQSIRDRVFMRINHEELAEEVYAPLIDQSVTNAELKELIAFYRTSTGQRACRLITTLAFKGSLLASPFVNEIIAAVQEEIGKENMQKHPWKRTVADLLAVATAAEAYATDTNRYPNVSSYEQLRDVLSPTYIKELPEKDAWGVPYSYNVSSDGQHYRFASAGADGRFDWNSRQVHEDDELEMKEMDDLDADIIFQDGLFLQLPSEKEREP